MTNWDRLEEIFAQAIDLAPAERPAFLDQRCASVPELRAELESLLQAHEQAAVSFASRSAAVRDILGAIGSGFLTGKTLGHYKLETIIGEGGMGVVYRAVDTRTQTPVAVKVLPQELALDSPWRRRFSREVRTTAAIQHPHVVRIFDFGEDAGCLFLVMELIEGETLRARLAKGALQLDKVLDYAIQIAMALEAAHAAGVIHHDLKPGNIMLTPGEQLKVVDFGLSRFEDDSESSRSRLSQVGTPAGTIDYLSPEQAGGRPVDTRSDLFAMGSVLYEMLSGRRAFHRSSNLETAAAILRDRPAPLPDAVPAPVAALVDRCLAKDAAKRVQSAAEFRSALEALRAKLLQGKLRPQRFRRARRIAVLAIPAAVLVAALLVFAVVRSRAPARAPRFQRLTDDPHVTMDPALSRDGRWLAYASDRAEDGNLDIWIQPTGSGTPRRLTNHPARDHEPALSPDGSLAAFRSERDPAGIYTMPVNGGHERLLAAGGRGPQFSPDGRWIAYWTGPEVSGDAQAVMHTAIFVIPATGGKPRRLAADFIAANHPVWAPDSSQVLFASHRDPNSGEPEFWSALLDGGAPQLRVVWSTDGWNSGAPPTPCAWPTKDSVLLRWLPVSTVPSPGTQIWRLRLPAHPRNEVPAPRQLTSGAGPYDGCTSDSTGRIVVASALRRSAIWSVPIDPDSARLRGALAPLALEGERTDLPSMSANGKLMLFEVTDPRGQRRWVFRNLASGTDAVVQTGKSTRSLVLTPDGRRVSAVEGIPGIPMPPITLPPALEMRMFRAIPLIWDLSKDGSIALSTGNVRPRSVTLSSLRANDVTVILEHPAFSLYVPYFSPDERWIVFTAINGVDPARLFAAPLRPPYPIPLSSWIDLGEGVFGRWAPSGNRIYFAKDHDGARCLYTRALDPRTKRPISDAEPVLHLHSAWRSPLQLDPGYFRLIVAPDRLVFPLGEARSNLWVAEP